MQLQLKKDIHKLAINGYLKVLAVSLMVLVLVACGGSGGSASPLSDSVSVSGKVTPQRDSDIDLDLNIVNDLNNDINDPQLILNPSTLGGYLSASAGSYSNGELYNQDTIDAFSVSLVEGQKIFFSIFGADTALTDVDLEINFYDSNAQKQRSLSISEFSAYTLTAPSDDIYTIVLEAKGNSSPLLYTLAISQTISNSAAFSFDTNQLAQDFVPGEVLIRYKSTQYKQAIATSSQNRQTSVAQHDTIELIHDIPAISSLYRINSSALKSAFTINQTDPGPKLTKLEQKIQTLEFIQQLRQRNDIEFAEPNFIFKATNSPSLDDPRLPDQWNLSMIAAQAAWEASTGENVKVAVLDSGIDASHEEWLNKIHSSSYDFISSSVSAGDGNGADPDPNDEGTNFHGSHVAGIIGATANNAKGIAGLAYNADIMALRVLGVQDTGSSSDIAQAILYAAGLPNNTLSPPSQAADIINMSFGSDALSQTIKDAIDLAYQQGLILVAAAGNSNTDKPFYPAAFDNVIGVGAVSSNKQRSGFSNLGVNVQLVAPGGTGSGSEDFDGFQDAIISTIDANNYAEYQGTSMSAPHVSGVAALMKQLNSSLNGANLIQAIQNGSITESVDSQLSNPSQYFGAGIINAVKAVKWASNSNAIITPNLSAYPTQFSFSGNNTKATLSLTNQGDGVVVIESITPSKGWLTATPSNIDQATGLGDYLVEASPLTRPNQAELTLRYKINNGATQQQVISVFVSSSTQTDATVGTLFISLFKEENILNDEFTPFISVGGQLVNGAYEYCFNSVPLGRYLLSASTDNDKDQIAFDKGEAVGTYPVPSRPVFIELTGANVSNIDFDIQYPAFSSSSNNAISLPENLSASINRPFYMSASQIELQANNSCTN